METDNKWVERKPSITIVRELPMANIDIILRNDSGDLFD